MLCLSCVFFGLEVLLMIGLLCVVRLLFFMMLFVCVLGLSFVCMFDDFCGFVVGVCDVGFLYEVRFFLY